MACRRHILLLCFTVKEGYQGFNLCDFLQIPLRFEVPITIIGICIKKVLYFKLPQEEGCRNLPYKKTSHPEQAPSDRDRA